MNEDAMLMQWEDDGGAIHSAPPPDTEPVNLQSMMGRWENGELDRSDCVRLFQYLVDSRLAWSLPGRFARFASYLIREGLVNTAFHPLAPGISDVYAMGKVA